MSTLTGSNQSPAEFCIEYIRRTRGETFDLARMDMTDQAYHLIKNTPKVTGFLGADKSKPVPIPDAEAERIENVIRELPHPTTMLRAGESPEHILGRIRCTLNVQLRHGRCGQSRRGDDGRRGEHEE